MGTNTIIEVKYTLMGTDAIIEELGGQWKVYPNGYECYQRGTADPDWATFNIMQNNAGSFSFQLV